MEIADVVRKLTGAIEPVGETHTDTGRLQNLRAMTALVDELLHDIADVSKHTDATEFSRKQAGKHAKEFIRYVCEEFSHDYS